MPARGREWWAAVGATATGFFVLVAHALLETSRDTLFLANIPSTRLPWMYLTLAVLGVAVSEIAARTAKRLDPRRLLIASQGIAAAGTLAIAFLVQSASALSYYALYLWVGVASMSVLVRYWQHLSGSFTVTDAKRLFPLIGTGSVVGALAGYALAGFLSRTVGMATSIPIAAGFFATSMLGPLLFFTSPRRDSGALAPLANTSVAESFRTVMSQTYLRRIAIILVIASVTVTIGDFVFKSFVARDVDPATLGSFFARAYFGFSVASFFVLVVMVNPLVQRLGVTGALALLPAVLLLGSVSVLALGGLASAIVLKSADGALRFSSHKTAVELLYVPLSSSLRDTVKSAMDVLAQRLGQALGSLLILGALLLTDSMRLPAAMIAALSLAWVVLALTLKEDYLDLFRATLRQGPDESVLEFPDLDVASLETLVAALSSPQDEKVIAAMELLEQKSKGHLVPGLILHHPAPPVVSRALDLFARTKRKDVLPFLPRLAEHEYAEVRAAALRARTELAPDEAALRQALEHHCPVVNVTALVGLTVHGWTPVEEGVRELLKHAEKDSELARPMIARAIRYHPLPAFVPVLRRLAADPDLETRRQAILAMRATGAIELVPNLIAALAERALREDARDALVALGVPALTTLEVALGDASMPAAIRIHLPRTVARFQSQRAAEMLVRHLVSEPRGTMRYRALRGLGRMVANDPSLKLDEKALDGILESMVMTLFQRLHWQMTLAAGAIENPSRRTPGHELLTQLLRDKETLAIERLFRVLGLRYRGEQWADVYEGIDSDDPVARSSGRELLESVLPREIGRAVAALTAEAPAENRLGEAGDFYRPVSVSYEELIELLAGERGETLRLVARYHAVEIGLRADTEGFMRPAEDEPGWIEPLRDLANKMARDLPPRTSEATGDA